MLRVCAPFAFISFLECSLWLLFGKLQFMTLYQHPSISTFMIIYALFLAFDSRYPLFCLQKWQCLAFLSVLPLVMAMQHLFLFIHYLCCVITFFITLFMLSKANSLLRLCQIQKNIYGSSSPNHSTFIGVHRSEFEKNS